MYSHLLTIFNKIPISRAGTFYEEESFKRASFGAKNGEVFKINGSFYRVKIKEHLTSSPAQRYNVIVKHKQKILKTL